MSKSPRFYLLFGSNGQVGKRLYQRICSEPEAVAVGLDQTHFDLNGDTRNLHASLDEISSRYDAQFRGSQVVTLFAAAYTHVDGCELDPDRCEKINVTNTIEVLDYARKHWNSKLVFFSSDYVFDGQSGPYSEEEPMRPLSAYGRAKRDVEMWLNSNYGNRLIIRTTGVFDYDPISKNFVMQVLERLKKNLPVRVVHDQYATPVWSKELADSTIDLVRASAVGTYHAAGGGSVINRVELAQAVARAFGYDPRVIQGISTVSLRQPAARPMRGGLICEKMKKLIGWAPSSAEAALKRLASNISN